MQISTKSVFKLLSMACVLLAIGIGASNGYKAYRQATQREVWIDCDIPHLEEPPDEPVSVLASAVFKDRLSARIKLRWSDGVANTWYEGWMLYDRRKNTLEFNDVVRGEDGNDRLAYSFTNVTDEILINFSNTSVNLFDLPKLLVKFGCGVRTIADTEAIVKN